MDYFKLRKWDVDYSIKCIYGIKPALMFDNFTDFQEALSLDEI